MQLFRISVILTFISTPWEMILRTPKVWEHKGIKKALQNTFLAVYQHYTTIKKSPAWASALLV